MRATSVLCGAHRLPSARMISFASSTVSLVGDIKSVLAPPGFERRSLQQSLAVTQKPFSASGWNRMVRSDNDLPTAERERKKRIRPNEQRAEQCGSGTQCRAGPQQCSFDQLHIKSYVAAVSYRSSGDKEANSRSRRVSTR